MVIKQDEMGGFSIKKVGEEDVIDFNFLGVPFPPSIEDSEVCMHMVMQKLLQVKKVDRIMLSERRIFEYSREQTGMLKEIADLALELRNSKLFKPSALEYGECQRCVPGWFKFIQRIVTEQMLRDPIGAYVELKRRIRHEKLEAEKEVYEQCSACRMNFSQNVLSVIRERLEQTMLIQVVKDQLEGYTIGDRSVYRRILRPTMRPNFTFTRLMAEFPEGGEEVESYKVMGANVTIFNVPGSVRLFYHIMPPEFKLNEDQFELLDRARVVMGEHKPRTGELVEPERVRASFHDIAYDLIRDFAKKRRYSLSNEEVDQLADILTRETAGYGVLEMILADTKIQDITVNSPPGRSPIFVYHADAEDCATNIIPTREEVESWAARLRLSSGRPLDRANPVLDTAIEVPEARARVAALTRSLSPFGLAFALRRHRAKPWTYPLFIENNYISPLAAGLMSFLVDGSRTLLIAGTRSAGKTSFLGATMLEIMRRYRIITVEDTLELPGPYLMNLGYNIQPLKVQSAIVQLESELSAADGIRTSLRLGDSCLIVGEVRSEEAKALYEAMRVGALANVVAGTIHGDSPYGVYDRVVNDLKVEPTSFKATDIIAVANPIKSADGLHKMRRVVQISEVRKHWKDDPISEKGFVDLMVYDAKDDELKPTPTLVEGESEIISSIAARVREWVGNFDAVWDNIMLRANTKQRLVELAHKSGDHDILEADFVVKSNDMVHLLSDQVSQEIGVIDNDLVFDRWESWVKKEIRKRRAQ